MVRDRQHGPVVELNRIQVTGVPGVQTRWFRAVSLVPAVWGGARATWGAPGGELTAFFITEVASLTQKHKKSENGPGFHCSGDNC